MIVVVDDEAYLGTPYWRELADCGYKLQFFETADAAYNALKSVAPADVHLVLVDLHLPCEPDGRFAADSDYTYFEIGLLLLNELIDTNPVMFPSRSVLWTAAPSGSDACVAAHLAGIRVLYKREVLNSRKFAETVRSLVMGAGDNAA
jgi:CheY-like chemotaxis protein